MASIKETRDAIKALPGMTALHTDGEWRVTINLSRLSERYPDKGRAWCEEKQEGMVYYTTDADDALATAKKMSKVWESEAQRAEITREQARFIGFNVDTTLGKFTAIVKLEEGMSDRDARSDAISLMCSSFGGIGSIRVGSEAHLLAEMPEDAWEEKKCIGWGWVAKGGLPEQGAAESRVVQDGVLRSRVINSCIQAGMIKEDLLSVVDALERIASWDANKQLVYTLYQEVDLVFDKLPSDETKNDFKQILMLTESAGDYLEHPLLAEQSDESDTPVWAIDHRGDALVGDKIDEIVDADEYHDELNRKSYCRP